MKRNIPNHGLFRVLLGSASALVLSACGGGSSSDSATPVVPAGTEVSVSGAISAAGLHRVAVQTGEAVVVGLHVQAASGEGLIVLASADERATALYHRAAGSTDWKGFGVDVPEALTLASSTPRIAAEVSLVELAGSYQSLLASHEVMQLHVSSDGAITSSGSACQLAGQLRAGNMPNTLHGELTSAQCEELPAKFQAYAIADQDYAPAKMRLLVVNGSIGLARAWVAGQLSARATRPTSRTP